MMIKKPFGKKVLSIILVIVIAITPFSYVKADTHTIDDLYNALSNILIVLNGYGQNMPTDGINDQIQDLQDLFDTIFVDNTYSYTSGAAGTVTNRTFMDLMEEIATLSFSIPESIMEGYYLSDQSGTIHKINGLADMLEDITDFLSEIDAGQSINETRLRSIMNSTSQILTTLNTVSTTISNILTTDSNIYNLQTNFYNYIQNGTFKQDIDNAIDTITWISLNNNLSISTSLDGPYDTNNNTGSNNTLYLRFSLNSNTNHSIYKIITGIYNANNTAARPVSVNYKVYYDNGSGTITERPYQDIAYIDNSGQFLTIYVNTTLNGNSSRAIIFEFDRISSETSYLRFSYSNSYVYKIDDTDIEYWQLLYYFDLHRLLMDYESVNSSELDKLKQENTNLQTTLIDFNNLENTISTDFQNSIVSFNGNLQESTSMFGRITNSVTWFSAQMQNIFDVSSDFKMLLIMPMILGIALWFIGRGSFILRSSGKNGKRGNSS